VGNWFPKGKRGLLGGIWNTQMYVGNTVGTLVAAALVQPYWGWCFVVPALIMGGMAFVALFSIVNCKV
jgi:sugar phosphate permease